MRSFCCADFLIGLVVIIAVFLMCAEAGEYADIEQGKNRRGSGTSGLFPFARVGRSDPSLINNMHEDTTSFENLGYPVSLEDYEDFLKTDTKRASLIAFPRVGRTSESEFRKLAHLLALQQALDKRTGPSATSGLWFGPRLGKRSVNAHERQHDSKGQKEQH